LPVFLAVDSDQVVLDATQPQAQACWMEMIRAVLGFILLPAFLSGNAAVAGQSTTNPPPCRVTFELRDGSRVVGQSDDDFIRFHSPLLGDLKLAVQEISAVEYASTNSAKLTTAKGDTLMVWFADSQLKAKTSFGKIQLAVDTIRKLTVSASGVAGARRPGLVALWSGEDNGRDSIGTNDAELMDINFADGQAGRAFLLNGDSSWMKIPASPSLDIGKGAGLTISAWIKPSNVISFHPILEWEVTRQKNAVQLWLGHLPQDRGVLFGNVGDDQGNTHSLCSAPGAVVSGRFQHIALTYDKTSGMGKLFVNGRVVAQENLGIFTPHTTDDLFISRRPCDRPGDWTYNTFFGGLLDEIAIYNRALSTSEIQAICNENNNGEPLPPPPVPEISSFQRMNQVFQSN